ncbi:Hypothetical predicted protein [Podarcis lilfordi]|uniref:Uncharacterized protein n=1 Tax=Podarcis lilfordi TaxID=74358 RepID=A0AA35PR78_9SAUR|nr:Hypothetical predicted protein [Podarcis lilfordi]
MLTRVAFLLLPCACRNRHFSPRCHFQPALAPNDEVLVEMLQSEGGRRAEIPAFKGYCQIDPCSIFSNYVSHPAVFSIYVSHQTEQSNAKTRRLSRVEYRNIKEFIWVCHCFRNLL